MDSHPSDEEKKSYRDEDECVNLRCFCRATVKGEQPRSKSKLESESLGTVTEGASVLESREVEGFGVEGTWMAQRDRMSGGR